jgi:hypothetical protein
MIMKKLVNADYSQNHGGILAIIYDNRSRIRGGAVGDRRVSIASIRSYDMYNSIISNLPITEEDIQESIERSRNRGHELVWINLSASCICSDPDYYKRDNEKWANAVHLEMGEIVEFEGNTYRIDPAHNGNFKLTAVADERL